MEQRGVEKEKEGREVKGSEGEWSKGGWKWRPEGKCTGARRK